MYGACSILLGRERQTATGQILKTTLLNAVSRRLGSLEGNKIIAKSTLIDPRFKKTAFGPTENASNVQKWICDELGAITSEPDHLNTTTASADINAHEQKQSNSLRQQFDSKLLGTSKNYYYSKCDDHTDVTPVLRHSALGKNKKSIGILETI